MYLIFSFSVVIIGISRPSSFNLMERLTSLSQRFIFICGIKSDCLMSPISVSILSFQSDLTGKIKVLFWIEYLSVIFFVNCLGMSIIIFLYVKLINTTCNNVTRVFIVC